MHIVTLTEKKFNENRTKFDINNYKQTSEYAKMMQKNGFKILYLGLEDDNENVACMTLILEKRFKGKYKIGYAPNGFLIDYKNYNLLSEFTKNLHEHLTKLNYIYLRLNPIFNYKVYDSHSVILKSQSNILDNFKSLGYILVEPKNKFEKFEAILNTNDDINAIYNSFNRNIKRKIKDCNLIGITLLKNDDLDTFYKLVSKKNKHSLEYYKQMKDSFNNDNCKFEIYFAKLNPEIYLNNYRYLLKNELEINNKLNEKMINMFIPKTKKLLDKKINSDKLINKYKQKVIEASEIFSKYPDGLIVGTCAIIVHNKCVYFIEEGYEEKLRNIYSIAMLKWEIIKLYSSYGYNIFNLGQIPPSLYNKGSKFYGLYLSKTSFNPQIFEYCDNLDLVVNKYIYKLIMKLQKRK